MKFQNEILCFLGCLDLQAKAFLLFSKALVLDSFEMSA